MKRLGYFLAIAAMTLMAATPLMAQQKKVASSGGTSPHETIGAVVDGNRVTITYGRPFSKDPKNGEPRKIWGALVPYGKVWRTGSDEATTLITQKDIVIGDLTLAAGAYTLYTQPEENGTCKLIVNKALGQWGVPYSQQGSELGRVDMKKGATEAPVDQFTMKVAKNPAGAGGVIQLSWENTSYSVPFALKK